MKNFFFFFVSIFFASITINVNAQYIPIPIDMKIAESELIVEGRVSAKKAYRTNGKIFTENIVEIQQIIKGDFDMKSVSVITLGGQIGDYLETWTHLPVFSQNEYGVFFLKPTERPIPKSPENNSKFFDIFSGSQGFYRISEFEGNLKAISVLESFNKLENLYSKLNAKRKDGTKSPFRVSSKNSNCLNIKIVPKFDFAETQSNTAFQADILIKTTESPVNIHSIDVLLEYDTVFFGSNISNSGNLTFTPGELVTNYYSLGFDDYSANQIEILYEADGTDPENLEEVGLQYRKLATVSLELEDWSNEDPISWNEDSGVINNYFVNEEGFIEEFSCTKLIVGEACNIDVTGIFPTKVAAGVGDMSLNPNPLPGVVTITGNNFGIGNGIKPPEGHRVKFRNFEDEPDPSPTDPNRRKKVGWITPFEGDYLEWTETQIRVKVPSYGYYNDTKTIISDLNTQIACSGAVRVCRDDDAPCDCFDDASETLYIAFSARNSFNETSGCKKSIPHLFRDMDTNGGYTFYFGTGFDPNTSNGAFNREKFIEALETWRCTTKVNFDLDKVNSPPPPLTDGTGVIDMVGVLLPAGTLGATRVKEKICNSDHYQVKSFTIKIKDQSSWYDSSFPNFLRSVMLHELGHCHLLLHTCNGKDKVMHPHSSPVDPIVLSNDDIDGGKHETNLGASGGTDCDVNDPMKPLTGNCSVPTVEVNDETIVVNVFPNPIGDYLNIDFLQRNIQGNIQVIDIIGNSKIFFPISNQSNKINVSKLSQGIYYVILELDNGERHYLETIQKI